VAQDRDDFPMPVIEALSKRAAFICSNPSCRALTIAPSEADEGKWIYAGKAAHICAAAPGGPLYKASLPSDERKSASNGIFLCSFCADMIDKNDGIDFPEPLLREWKAEHEKWVRENLNKRQTLQDNVTFQVNSVGQMGGITAGVVNLAPPRRQMNDEIGAELMRHLPDRSRVVTIAGRMGNAEAMSFASQIAVYLRRHGYQVEGPSEAVFGRFVHPVEVNADVYAIKVESVG
jgi:hypothetical protein